MDTTRYLLVSSRALPGREDDYRKWYVQRHIREVLAIPGFLSGKFFRCVGPDGQPTGEFNGLYEVDSEDAPAILGALMSRSGEMNLSDAIEPASVKFTFLFP